MKQKVVEVIGVTTDIATIPRMLGVATEHECALYKETPNGHYYAKIGPDGTFGTDIKVIRLLSPAQAAKAEGSALDEINRIKESFVIPNPAIDMERFDESMKELECKNKTIAEQMGKSIQNTLKGASFRPSTN